MLNRVVLIGRLVADPDPLKYTANGVPVAHLRIAVDRPMSSEARSSGQAKQTDFINVVAWRKTAEFAANYLTKGRLISVDGRLQIREYETQDGQKRRDAEIIADNVEGLDCPKDGADSGGYGGQGGGSYEEAPARPPAPRPAPAAAPPAANRAPAAAPPARGAAAAYADDDIDDPFADN